MRLIIFIGGSYLYGMERSYLTLIPALRSLGCEVHAVIGGWNDGKIIPHLQERGIPYTALKLPGRPSLRKPHWTIEGLRCLTQALGAYKKLLAEFRPDVMVHTNTWTGTIAGLASSGVKHVFHLHNVPDDLMFRLPISWVRRHVSLFLSPSGFIDEGVGACGVSSDRRAVSFYGFEDLSVQGSRGLQQDNRLPSKIVLVSQLIPRKRVDVVIRAVAMLRARGRTDFCLHVYGDGQSEYKAQLQSEVKVHRLENLIEWHGYVDDQSAMYDGAILKLSASENEPSGVTFYEAARAGIPVVAARSGGNPELVVDGQTGILFPPGDHEALAKGIEKLLDNPKLREDMGIAARARFERVFRADAYAERFMTAVSKL